jgi:hypothetical protein
LKFDLRTVWPEMFVEQRPKVLQKSTTSTHCFGKLSRTYNNVLKFLKILQNDIQI